MIPKCSLNGYNAYIQFFGLLFMAFILVVVVMFYLQARHAEITEKYNNINTTGQIDMKTIEFKPPTDAGNRSTFPEDKYPGANYELIGDGRRTSSTSAVGNYGILYSTTTKPPPRTTDIYKMRDCKVYFTDDIKGCDYQVDSPTKTCSYTFDGWKEFDTYIDNNENTLTYPIKKYKPDASNTNELINAHFTSKCFKEFDNAGKGGAKRFEFKENRLVKFDSKGVEDNTEIDTNIFGGKKYTSIQFMNGENPQDNLSNVIDSICSVKYNRIQVLNGKTFYKFILSGSGDNRTITSIDKLSLIDDQSGFNRVDTVAINDFAILGSHGLRFNNNDKLQIFINESAINVNMNIFKFTYVTNLCSNSQIKQYAIHPVNLRITDLLRFGAVEKGDLNERVVEGIDTSLITNKGSYKGRTADGKYIDYKKQILDDLEGRRQSEIMSIHNGSGTRKAEYNSTMKLINDEMTTAYNTRNNFTVQDNTFLNVLNLYNRNGNRIFDYASGYKNNNLNHIAIPSGVEVIFMNSSDICMVFKNNTNENQTHYSFSIPVNETYECEILVVGGGGGGGHFGGGGGGGGILFSSSLTLNSESSITVKVGKGGNGAVLNTFVNGANGSDSSIKINSNEYIANGGGGGGTRTSSSSAQNGNTGGSGGGGSSSNRHPQALGGGSNIKSYANFSSFGNGGGSGKPDAWHPQPLLSGGGGGGAGGAGFPWTYAIGGGNGGLGKEFISYFGTSVGHKGYFGGGGGGNTYNAPGMTIAGDIGYGNGGSGLYGGGGNGALDGNTVNSSLEYAAGDGMPNTGGGGGGSKWDHGNTVDNDGGNGGSGVVILKLKRKITIQAITTSFESYYKEDPVSTITIPPLRIQSNILTSFVYLQKGFYRFRADLGNQGMANPNIVYAELVIYDESNLSGSQYNCKKVFKYNLYNNRYLPSYLRQYIHIPTNKFYKLAYSYYYINNTSSSISEDFKLYYSYSASNPDSLDQSNLVAYYKFNDSSSLGIDSNPSTTKYNLKPTIVGGTGGYNTTIAIEGGSFQATNDGDRLEGDFPLKSIFDNSATGISVSCWFYKKSGTTNDNPYYTSLFQFTNPSDANQDVQFSLGHYNNTHYLNFATSYTSGQTYAGGFASNQTLDTWYHVVFIISKSGNIKVYFNGTLITINVLTYGGSAYPLPRCPNTTKLRIFNPYGSGAFSGNIDEFYVFNKELSQTEVSSLYNKTHSSNNDDMFSPSAINNINTPMNQFLFNGANVNEGYRTARVRNVFSTISYENNDYKSYKNFQNLATYIDTDGIDYFRIRILTKRRNDIQSLIDGEGARLTGEIRGSTTIANLNTLTNAIKSINYKGLLPVGNPQLLSSKTFTMIFGGGNEANYITTDKVRDLNNLANPGLTEAVYIEALN